VPERGEYAVKVLDFGIAKVMDAAGGMGTKTRTGAVLGTPGYMSPEQIKNAKAVDPRTDLWAVGVVLYEMLCRVHPFGAENNVGRMVAVLSEAPRPISQVDGSLAKWDAFFERALAREPAARFQSAEEMGEALRAVAAQQPEAPRLEPQHLQTVALPIPLVAPSSMPPSAMGAAAMVAIPGAPPTGVGTVEPVHTKVSGDRPPGVPTLDANRPHVHITEAEPLGPPALVWWAVLLVAIACFALGLAAGYQLAVG
jgi:serine/threonine-protein kinase